MRQGSTDQLNFSNKKISYYITLNATVMTHYCVLVEQQGGGLIHEKPGCQAFRSDHWRESCCRLHGFVDVLVLGASGRLSGLESMVAILQPVQANG